MPVGHSHASTSLPEGRVHRDLIADKHLTALSNMDVATEVDIQSEISGTTKKSVTFNKSPKMSTYLVAFVVGELNYIESNRLPCARPMSVPHPARTSSMVASPRISLPRPSRSMRRFLASTSSCREMDKIAIPDFAAGAMENWGLVTYRVVDLMLDEKASGAATKERVAEVVQHELAHQWFGNLVTMDWWEGLWLNEGFATWASWVGRISRAGARGFDCSPSSPSSHFSPYAEPSAHTSRSRSTLATSSSPNGRFGNHTLPTVSREPSPGLSQEQSPHRGSGEEGGRD